MMKRIFTSTLILAGLSGSALAHPGERAAVARLPAGCGIEHRAVADDSLVVQRLDQRDAGGGIGIGAKQQVSCQDRLSSLSPQMKSEMLRA